MSDALTNIEKHLMEAIGQAQGVYHKLVLLVGPSRSGKTPILRRLAKSTSGVYLNINLRLSQRILELPRTKRPRHIDQIFAELMNEHPGNLRILDNIEVLFDLSLQLDALRSLELVSRHHTVVASWNGTLRNGQLTYAEPDHPEYKSYRNVDAVTVVAGKDSSPDYER